MVNAFQGFFICVENALPLGFTAKPFMNRDVVAGSIVDSHSLNRYAYVNGNPVSYIDPFGLAREAINANLSFTDWVHLGLDGLGLIPVVGELADGANALFYLSKGDYTNAIAHFETLLKLIFTGVFCLGT